MTLIIAIIILVIYLACPLIGKALLLFVNTVIQDPIPFVDEIIMWIGFLSNLSRTLEVAAFTRKHKATIKKVGLIFGAIVALLIICIVLSQLPSINAVG